jgi:hypothetical protein
MHHAGFTSHLKSGGCFATKCLACWRCAGVALALLLSGSAEAVQVQLQPSNGIWLKPASGPVIGNEASLVATHNTQHPTARLDGVQIDIEGVSGTTLLNLVSAVQVSTNLVISAAIQSIEFYSNIESSYASLRTNTDLDVLVTMLYIMDGIGYDAGTATFRRRFRQATSAATGAWSLGMLAPPTFG